MYEARTPLIISGPADETPDLYIKVNRVVPKLVRQTEAEGEGDYWVDEKAKQVHLSEDGQEHAENLLREAGILERSEEHTSELQYLMRTSYAVFCLHNKNTAHNRSKAHK